MKADSRSAISTLILIGVGLAGVCSRGDVYVTRDAYDNFGIVSPAILRFSDEGAFTFGQFPVYQSNEGYEGIAVAPDGSVVATDLTMGVGSVLHFTSDIASLAEGRLGVVRDQRNGGTRRRHLRRGLADRGLDGRIRAGLPL